MAKDNLFLGQARGKVGDIVFYRQDGVQITRTRNRHPRNPRTEPQLYQRAIMATVSQAYKAGRQLFDHSFEGFSVGAQNQREFLRTNAKLLRSLIAQDLAGDATPGRQLGKVIGPGTAAPVGFPGMVISAGNYPMTAFVFTKADEEGEAPANFKLPTATEGETRAAYATRVGLIAGDYFTFAMFHFDDMDDPVLFQVQLAGNDFTAMQYRQHFSWLRLGVRSDFVKSTDPVAGATLSDVFVFDTFAPDIDVTGLQAASYNSILELGTLVLSGGNARYGYFGLIRSRLDSGVRSDSSLVYAGYGDMPGIASAWALDAWSQGTASVGNSELILEGGGF